MPGNNLFRFASLLLLGIWTGMAWVFAQQSSKIGFDYISPQQGLSQNSVYTVEQDQTGFLWIGTQDGLNRFDGYKVKNYFKDHKDSTSISSGYVNKILEDSEKDLLIGTVAGLNIYHRKSDSFTRLRPKNYPELSEVSITAIEEHTKGKIWLGTTKGLFLWDKAAGTVEVFLASAQTNSLIGNEISTLHQDRSGVLWVGTPNGLSTYKNGKFKNHKNLYESKSQSEGISSLFEDKAGDMWVADNQGKLFKHHKNDGSFAEIDFKSGAGIDRPFAISGIYEDAEGSLWIITNGIGLFVFNQKTDVSKHYTADNEAGRAAGLADNTLLSVFEDRLGILWIGTQQRGVAKLDLKKQIFPVFQNTPGDPGSLPTTTVSSLALGQDGIVWLASQSAGLIRHDRKAAKYEVFKHPSMNFCKFVLADDAAAGVWVADYRAGLFFFNTKDKKFEHYPVAADTDNKKANNMRFIMDDGDGFLWIGTWGGGMHKFDKKSKTYKKTFLPEDGNPKSITDNQIFAIVKGDKGLIWIGTFQGGLLKMDPKTEEFYAYKNNPDDAGSISDGGVFCIYENGGKIWTGTFGGGLNVLDKATGKFRAFTQKEGLSNNSVYAVLPDKSGHLWLPTNKGLSVFNPSDFSFKNFTAEDGLQDDEFNAGAYHKGRTGELMFGGVNGYNLFHPDSLRYNTYIPPVVVTEFSVQNIPQSPTPWGSKTLLQYSIEQTEQIELSYKTNFFAFEFSAINFRNADKNRYAYQLEGFNEDWVYVDAAHRNVTFTNLSPGQYSFKVKGSNNDGLWNPKETLIKINIRPPFWDTLVFKIFAVLAGVGAVIAFNHSRVRIINKQKKKLMHLVTERTQEIMMQAEELAAQKDNMQLQNNMLEESYHKIQVLSKIGQSITASIDMGSIVSKVYAHVNELMDAEAFGIGIYDEATNCLTFAGFVEKGEVLAAHSLHVEKDAKRLAVQCFNERKTVLINDIYTEYFGKNEIEAPKEYEGKITESIMYLPIMANEHWVGVITVQSFKKHAYGQQELNILENLAAYIGIAIDNAAAYGKISEQNQIIETKNSRITDSIRYAKRIQDGILGDKKEILSHFEDGFIFYKPKDIVSGDFYWFGEKNGKKILIVADCTGHGVPGAFMTVLGSTAINEIVFEKNIASPSQILYELDYVVQTMLSKTKSDYSGHDGMDLSIVCFHTDTDQGDKVRITFAGAKHPLYWMSGGEMYLQKGDMFPIGMLLPNTIKCFDEHEIVLKKGDTLYLFSDGYRDQYSENDQKKYMLKAFRLFLASISSLPMADQERLLAKEFDGWRGANTQTDDVLVVGIKV